MKFNQPSTFVGGSDFDEIKRGAKSASEVRGPRGNQTQKNIPYFHL